jgi:hypothetical protein
MLEEIGIHVFFTVYENPLFTFYAIVSAVITASLMKNNLWFFIGWFCVPFGLVIGAILIAGTVLYIGIRYSWLEAWRYAKGPRSFARRFPNSPINLGHKKVRRAS